MLSVVCLHPPFCVWRILYNLAYCAEAVSKEVVKNLAKYWGKILRLIEKYGQQTKTNRFKVFYQIILSFKLVRELFLFFYIPPPTHV